MNGNKSHNPDEGGLQSPELNSFEKLTVAKLKAFLRSNDLKTTGVKAELVDRAKDFLSMKRLSAGGSDSSTAHTKAMQIIYPEASFCIPCKGDVCKGDEVLFVQEVFDDFKPQSRKGEHIGHRQVAGRIINESYGALKQQHTFTIEVLWSAGTQPKQPLSTMLIKGRNLYKLSVRRRSWQVESLRLAVLNEKHERGQEARMLRTERSKKGIKRKNRDNVRLLPCIRPPAGNSLYDNDGTANNVNNVLTCFVDLVDLTREEDEKSGEVVGMKNGNSAAAAGLIICLQQPLQLINNMAVRMPHAANHIASEGGRTCISAGKFHSDENCHKSRKKQCRGAGLPPLLAHHVTLQLTSAGGCSSGSSKAPPAPLQHQVCRLAQQCTQHPACRVLRALAVGTNRPSVMSGKMHQQLRHNAAPVGGWCRCGAAAAVACSYFLCGSCCSRVKCNRHCNKDQKPKPPKLRRAAAMTHFR